MRGKLAMVGTLAVMLTVAPAAGARTSRHAARCSLVGSRTVLATARARVFRRVRGDTVSVYACLYSRNRRFLLSREEFMQDSTFTRMPALAGRFVAYVLARTDVARRGTPNPTSFPDQVVAIDLASGQRRQFHAASTDSPSTRVSDLALASNGSVAWIGSGPEGNEVYIGTAGRTLLDRGSGVLAGSLALSRTAIYWTRDGVPRSASAR